MGNTSSELLDLLLRDEAYSSGLLDRALAEDEGRTFLSIVVERLADLFDPHLVQVYDRLFRETLPRVAPDLLDRLRQPGDAAAVPASASRVYVLSRVTLGADVAVTSVFLHAAKRRYPDAEIVFVGPRKNYELWEADPRIHHQEAPYARSGSLADRLRASASLWFEDGIVIDPDSRLSQLGMIRVCPEDRYLFFDSRSYGGDHYEQLPVLAARWAQETLGVQGSRPYIAPVQPQGLPADITVSLGVGENPAKRLSDGFERDLLQLLAETGRTVLVDKGGSPEEAARVDAALQPGMRTHEGAFAAFAAEIARSVLFVGYDSAGGHVASACHVPLIGIAAGFVSDRAASRWRPDGIIIDGRRPDPLLAVTGILRDMMFQKQP